MFRNDATSLRTRSTTTTTSAAFESLESRQMLASAVTVTLEKTQWGPAIVVNGTGKNDKITITQGSKGVVVSDGKKSTRINKSVKTILVNASSGNDIIVVGKSVKLNVWVDGGNGDDVIVGGSGRDTLCGGKGCDWIAGGANNDLLAGQDGCDSLFGNAGNDALIGGNGDDTLVAIGGGDQDSLEGDAGFDSFWLDDSFGEQVYDVLDSAESYAGAVHRVGGFEDFVDTNGNVQEIGTELNGGDLPDPELNWDDKGYYTAQGFANASDLPLFGKNGPMMDDVQQGALGTCYFLSTLSGIAQLDPQRIRQAVVALGDGTYAVRFCDGSGNERYVRVDGDLPANAGADGNVNFAYARPGLDTNAIWVPIMEKAWCFVRDMANATNPVINTSYHNVDSGYMDEVPTAMAADEISVVFAGRNNFANGYDMLEYIQQELAAGKLVTFGTQSKAYGGFVESHAYTVLGVAQGKDGDWYLIVRNPWGTDGFQSTDGSDDGYVAIRAADAFASMADVQSSWV